MKNAIKINKNQIPKIKFSQIDFKTPGKLQEIKDALKVATRNKKDGSGKVDIFFKTKNRGFFRINAAVLMVGRDFVMLKENYLIPIKSIKKVS